MQRDGDAAAAAAASYRVLSRLLGYGTGPEAGAAGGAGTGAGAAGAGPGGGGRLPGAGPALRSPRPQLMVFRNAAAEGRPGEDCGPAAAAVAAAGGGVPGDGGAELCPRHRCALEPKAAAGWGAAAQSGLELQLAALGLRPPGLGAKGAAGAAGTPCPCLGPPAGEETSDALLVLEALEPDEGGSGSEDEPGSPGRGAARAAGRAAPPGPAPPPAGTGPGPGPGGRKGSLRIRLSRLFRTKSCSGGSATGDAASAAASAGSLTDVCGARGREQEPGRKHRLTRTQSAFSPVVFSPLFTGETVSLVDVDISQRGLSSPHPPTPPPPPRRSLSLLDDISGTLPPAVLVGPMGSSLQSFPLPPPPPPHAPDAFPRIVPLRPPEAPGQPSPHLQCPLARPDPSSFAASLRELEKCGWYWGPMNWEDAEMKLKGKPDGSFLVRDSSDPRYILSLSFRSQGITHHTRMEHYRGGDLQPVVPPQVRGPLPVRGGVHQEGHHALQKREIPLLPAIPGPRSPSDARPAPVSRLQVQQRQIPAAPLPLPDPAAGPDRPHSRAPAAQAPDLLHPQVLLLRPAGGAVPVPQGGAAHLPTEAGARVLHVAQPALTEFGCCPPAVVGRRPSSCCCSCSFPGGEGPAFPGSPAEQDLLLGRGARGSPARPRGTPRNKECHGTIPELSWKFSVWMSLDFNFCFRIFSMRKNWIF